MRAEARGAPANFEFRARALRMRGRGRHAPEFCEEEDKKKSSAIGDCRSSIVHYVGQ